MPGRLLRLSACRFLHLRRTSWGSPAPCLVRHAADGSIQFAAARGDFPFYAGYNFTNGRHLPQLGIRNWSSLATTSSGACIWVWVIEGRRCMRMLLLRVIIRLIHEGCLLSAGFKGAT